jgi:hypothetical protein
VTQSALWRLDDHRAQLNLGDFQAAVDIAQPGCGLHEIMLLGTLIAPLSLLAARFAGQDPRQPQTVSDCFIRGRDLVVTYAQLFERPVRVQIYWRALGESDAPGCLAAIDVQVSVQTSLLEAWPALVIHSRVPTQVALRLTRDDAGRSDGTSHDDAATDSKAAGCWLCRLPELGLSYGEMVHPADVERAEAVTTGAGAIDIRHHLFSQPLEKGVILRARARGIFLPFAADNQMLDSAYQRFLAAPLPLTT